MCHGPSVLWWSSGRVAEVLVLRVCRCEAAKSLWRVCWDVVVQGRPLWGQSPVEGYTSTTPWKLWVESSKIARFAESTPREARHTEGVWQCYKGSNWKRNCGSCEWKTKPDVVHYIPHHAVIRRDKSTTKLRILYNASAKSDGASLNDCLHAGPALTQRIFDIMLRFRNHRVALVGDIEKAFLMVHMNEADKDVLRFLWVGDIDKAESKVIIMRFTRVVCGLSSSPLLLNATIKHHRAVWTMWPWFYQEVSWKYLCWWPDIGGQWRGQLLWAFCEIEIAA